MLLQLLHGNFMTIGIKKITVIDISTGFRFIFLPLIFLLFLFRFFHFYTWIFWIVPFLLRRQFGFLSFVNWKSIWWFSLSSFGLLILFFARNFENTFHLFKWLCPFLIFFRLFPLSWHSWFRNLDFWERINLRNGLFNNLNALLFFWLWLFLFSFSWPPFAFLDFFMLFLF